MSWPPPAPFAGVIVQRYLDSGVTVNAGQPYDPNYLLKALSAVNKFFDEVEAA